MTTAVPPAVRRAAEVLCADLPGVPALPSAVRFVAALLAATVLSLAACALVAAATTALVPSLATYDHLRWQDWTKLTVIGVPIACLGWPLAAVLWSRARTPFLVLTALVTVVSLAPDLWILRQGQPAVGVFALAVMHVAVALVTWPALVLIAPQRARIRRG